MTNNKFWKVLNVIFFILAVLCLSIVIAVIKNEKDSQKVVIDRHRKFLIDTDVGGDDAVALFLALAAKNDIDVIAITCVYGNTNANNVETNVLKVLTVANRTEIPVYPGSRLPLLQDYTETYYFGHDGLGDFDFGRQIKGSIDRSRHAANVMIELAKQYRGQLTIVTLGPVTNLAIAMSLDPDFVNNVDKFYTMGGWFAEDTNSSTSDPVIEFNFAQDPEAAAIVFKKSNEQNALITLMPYSLARSKRTSKEWRLYVLGASNSEVIQFLNKAERSVLERSNYWEASDPITVALAIWPELVLSVMETSVSVITCSTYKGASIIDSTNPTKNVQIITNFNLTNFKEKLVQYLT